MIYSDWHIHSEASYDAKLPLETLIARAREQGLRGFGVTDHLNFNDEKFLGDLHRSAETVKALQEKCPEMVLGVELTPIEKPLFDYVAKTGTREGFVPPVQEEPYGIELGASKEYLRSLGVRYAVGASHWRVDRPNADGTDVDACIREWFRQQMWLAQDPRVTILGHPWYNGKALWYDDFDRIPASMHDELGAALLENGKFAECNCSSFFQKPIVPEKFRYRYAEFLRSLFERGIRITYGSDCHGAGCEDYPDTRNNPVKYLQAAGFKEGDFSELSEKDLW